MKKKTYITDKATLNTVHRTVGKYPVRDAKEKDGKRHCTVTEKDWERGVKDSGSKCAAARSLARSLGIDYAEVAEYGMHIGYRTAYIPSYDKNGEIEVLRYIPMGNVHKLWDQGKFVKPTTISFRPPSPKDTLEHKRGTRKRLRISQGKEGKRQPPKRRKNLSEAYHVRGNAYTHHSCTTVD